MNVDKPFTAAVEIVTDKDRNVLWAGRYQFSRLGKVGSTFDRESIEYKILDCIQTRGRYRGVLIEYIVEVVAPS